MKIPRNPKRKINWVPIIFITPTIIMIGLFFLYPVVNMFWLSLTNFDFLEQINTQFVGLHNYIKVLTTADFKYTLWRTILYTIGTAGGAFLIGLLAALLLNNKFKGRLIARIFILFPWAVPPVVTGIVWSYMYDYQFGIINYFLEKLHLIIEPISWLGDPSVALISVILPSIWLSIPISTLVMLGGLHSIREELYDAAAVDGANVIQEFWHITIPGLRPITKILILLLVIWSFRSFDIIYMMTTGGPAGATETFVMKVYLTAFKYYDFTRATTYGVITLLISLVFSIVYWKMLMTKDER